ncbi:MAG: hypothetical protein LBN02_02600 [Oscillospiraceae bacterium]|nr:hypothetical protein [Oscillospiraceae bacterium]
MKKTKKLIAMLLVFAVMLSVCSLTTLAADETKTNADTGVEAKIIKPIGTIVGGYILPDGAVVVPGSLQLEPVYRVNGAGSGLIYSGICFVVIFFAGLPVQVQVLMQIFNIAAGMYINYLQSLNPTIPYYSQNYINSMQLYNLLSMQYGSFMP